MLTNFAIIDLSTPDLVIILAVVVLLFGAKKIPEVTKSVSASMHALRTGLDGGDAKQEKSQD